MVFLTMVLHITEFVSKWLHQGQVLPLEFLRYFQKSQEFLPETFFYSGSQSAVLVPVPSASPNNLLNMQIAESCDGLLIKHFFFPWVNLWEYFWKRLALKSGNWVKQIHPHQRGQTSASLRRAHMEEKMEEGCILSPRAGTSIFSCLCISSWRAHWSSWFSALQTLAELYYWLSWLSSLQRTDRGTSQPP